MSGKLGDQSKRRNKKVRNSDSTNGTATDGAAPPTKVSREEYEAKIAEILGKYDKDGYSGSLEADLDEIEGYVKTGGRDWNATRLIIMKEFDDNATHALGIAFGLANRGYSSSENKIIVTVKFKGGEVEKDLTFFCHGGKMPSEDPIINGIIESGGYNVDLQRPNARTFLSIFAEDISKLIKRTGSKPSLYRHLKGYDIPPEYSFPGASRIMPAQVYLNFLRYLVDRDLKSGNDAPKFAESDFDNWCKTDVSSTATKAEMKSMMKILNELAGDEKD